MDGYTTVIILTLVGFLLLAFILLAPIYVFLHREREASQKWTPEELAKQVRDAPPATNGAGHGEKGAQ